MGLEKSRRVTCAILTKKKSAPRRKWEKGPFRRKKQGKLEDFGEKGRAFALIFCRSPISYILNRKKYSTSAKKYATIMHNSICT